MAQIALPHGLASNELPEGIGDVVRDHLDRQPVGPTGALKPRSAQSRLRPEMRLMELFDAWKAASNPSPQTAHEQATRDSSASLATFPLRRSSTTTSSIMRRGVETAKLDEPPKGNQELTRTYERPCDCLRQYGSIRAMMTSRSRNWCLSAPPTWSTISR